MAAVMSDGDDDGGGAGMLLSVVCVKACHVCVHECNDRASL